MRQAAANQPPAAVRMCIDRTLRPDAQSLFFIGWLWDPLRKVQSVTLCVAEQRVVVQLQSYPRPDVVRNQQANDDARPGIVCLATIPRPAPASTPMWLEVTGTAAEHLRVDLPPVLDDCPFATRSELIRIMPSLMDGDLALTEFQSAMSRTMLRCAERRTIGVDITLGRLPERPTVSIVVPLYGGLDLLESQLDEFSGDGDLLARAELIYVLDSPHLADELRRIAPALHELYRVPFRCLLLDQHSGFGGASNAGAAAARGPLVLFLNSDVVPIQPGWLDALLRAWSRRPAAGAMSPKLVFEDGSLQHAGLYWAPDMVRLRDTADGRVDQELWRNHIYHKGLPGNLPPANVARQVPAIAAACMLVRKDLFDELGGFDETYVFGDCEDSDLCLRMVERGHEIWYEPDVALYHLEGQSYPDDLRRRIGIYNVWQQARRWTLAMAARMQLFGNHGQ